MYTFQNVLYQMTSKSHVYHSWLGGFWFSYTAPDPRFEAKMDVVDWR